MLKLEGVTKQYLYGARLFGAFDLTVGDGEIISVLGGEKSGKTSLLKAVAGIEDTEGRITLDGNPVKKKTDDVIMLFDDGAVFKYKTVFDNLAYPLTLRKLDKTEISSRVIRVAEQLGIGACLPLRAKKLSTLERRKMSVARLFLRDAKLLLLDDLTKGLNKSDARRIFEDVAHLLYEKAKEGTSVIYATSEPSEAIELGGRIVVLAMGDVKQIGTANELWNTPQSVWAAQAVDEDYNFQKCVLSVENDTIKLIFDLKNGNFTLDVDCLKDRIIPAYFGREVLVGYHPCDVVDGEIREQVKFVKGCKDGFQLETESGVRLLCESVHDEVTYAPKADSLTLYDAATESSIMRNYDNTRN